MKNSIVSREAGFALIVTISMMVLLSLLAIGLLSLSSIGLRASSATNAQKEAQANARIALMQAIGELQKFAGRDQSITAASSIEGDSIANPNWTGVWSVESDEPGEVDKESKPVWLVSGNDGKSVGDFKGLSSYPGGYFEPGTELPQDEAFEIFKADLSENSVKVPIVEMATDDEGKESGRYAWWVSDEGTKARVDLEGQDASDSVDVVRIGRAVSSQETNLTKAGDEFGFLSGRDAEVGKRSILSLNTVDLSAGGQGDDLSTQFFHDITTGGHGLPVNVVDGGMKTDLSITFDSSQSRRRSIVRNVMGAVPQADGSRKGQFLFPKVDVREKFYLSPELYESSNQDVGPNWGILYNFANLWKDLDGRGTIKPVVMAPPLRSDMRATDWAPYTNYVGPNAKDWRNDTQHINSPVAPIVSMIQVGFRLSSSPAPIHGTDPVVMGNQVKLQIKPLIGIWNPYNVKLQSQRVAIQLGFFPWMRIAASTPKIPGGKAGDRAYEAKQIRAEIWLRDEWQHGDGDLTSTGFGKRFQLHTGSVDFEPGEFRLFSVADNPKLNDKNKLVSTWNESGAFVLDLSFSKNDSQDSWFPGFEGGDRKFIIPNKSDIWFGSSYLEDTVLKKTRELYPRSVVKGVSGAYLTHTSGGGMVHRTANLWPAMGGVDVTNTGVPVKYVIPEPVISEWGRTGKINDKRKIGELAISPFHVSTWRFFLRTTTEAQRGQQIRSWVDCNPRYGAHNPAWDGSSYRDSQQGMHFISPFIGGSFGQSYDRGPRGRGKVAESQDEGGATPEADAIGGRYRGYGGLVTSTAGQTHVPIFDVPRAPLVSLGQFQHAQLARYGYEPGFPVGNSHANMRIPLGQTYVDNYNDIEGFRLLDLSHSVNKTLWDEYFFSTIGVDYQGGGSSTLEDFFPIDGLLSGEVELTNSRHRFIPDDSKTSLDKIVNRRDGMGAKALSAHISIDGAFNVNSTSEAAWRAVLGSMADYEFPVLSQDGTKVSWSEGEGSVRFPRFGHVMQSNGWSAGASEVDPSFWQGFREISDTELDLLAENLVEEIRARGPFRSLADFVNRDPDSSDADHQQRGALQVALDKSLNKELIGPVADRTNSVRGDWFESDAFDRSTESTAAGYAGYMLQSDVLQALAPIIQVRSDYFRVRAMGQATDSSGNVLATAVCEAFVQRSADYVDPADEPQLSQEELTSKTNEMFGRRFNIVTFRWLNTGEV